MPIDEKKYIEEFGTPDEVNTYFDKESALDDIKRIEATEVKEAVEKENELKAAKVADLEEKKTSQNYVTPLQVVLEIQ